MTAPGIQPQTPATPIRRRRRIVLRIVAILVIALFAIYQWGLTWFVRREAVAALQDAGIPITRLTVVSVTPWTAKVQDIATSDEQLKIAGVVLNYSPSLLFHRRIDRLTINQAQIAIKIIDGKPDLGPLQGVMKPKASSEAQGSSATSLPLQRIELIDSKVLLYLGGDQLTLPIHGTLTNESETYSIDMEIAGEASPIQIKGTIHDKDVSANLVCNSISMDQVHSVVAEFSANPIHFSGQAAMTAAVKLQNGIGSIIAEIRPTDARVVLAGGANLRLDGGVLSIDRPVGGDISSPAATVKVDGMNLSSTSSDISADGFTGQVVVSTLEPFVIPAGQAVHVDKFNSGKLKLVHGSAHFHADADGAFVIEKTHWQGLGGSLDSENIRIDPHSSGIAFTVVATGLTLRDLLDTFGSGKATGQGQISAKIPVRIKGSQVALGAGQVIASPQGNLQVTDAAALTDTLAASDPRFASGGSNANLKQDLTRALADFEFTTLRADLTNGDNGLTAHIQLVGKGRVARTQSYNLEFNLSGLNQVLGISLGLNNLVSGK